MRQFHVIESNFCPKIYRLFTKIKRKYGILEKMIVLYAIIIGKVWRGMLNRIILLQTVYARTAAAIPTVTDMQLQNLVFQLKSAVAGLNRADARQ